MERRTTYAVAIAVATLLLAGGTLWMGIAGAGAGEEPGDNVTTPPEDRSIAVTGHGSAEAPPDEATIGIAVVATGENVTDVRDALQNGSEALRTALSAANVSEDAIETVEYRIAEPEPRFEDEPGPDRPAYRGVHGYEVSLSDVDRTGAVVDAAADAGAEIQRVSFDLSDEGREQARDRALEGAVEDARRQAETLAAAGGLEVVGVHSIEAADHRPGPLGFDQAVAEDASAAQTVLQPGDVTVEVDVRVVYEAESTGSET